MNKERKIGQPSFLIALYLFLTIRIINFDGGNTSMIRQLANKLICSALRKCVMNANTAIFIINHAKVVWVPWKGKNPEPHGPTYSPLPPDYIHTTKAMHPLVRKA
ncbi:hypothetical protein ACTXT7_005607 [Hymenolepis weldensis]